jgi:hypothetical protein
MRKLSLSESINKIDFKSVQSLSIITFSYLLLLYWVPKRSLLNSIPYLEDDWYISTISIAFRDSFRDARPIPTILVSVMNNFPESLLHIWIHTYVIFYIGMVFVICARFFNLERSKRYYLLILLVYCIVNFTSRFYLDFARTLNGLGTSFSGSFALIATYAAAVTYSSKKSMYHILSIFTFLSIFSKEDYLLFLLLISLLVIFFDETLIGVRNKLTMTYWISLPYFFWYVYNYYVIINPHTSGEGYYSINSSLSSILRNLAIAFAGYWPGRYVTIVLATLILFTLITRMKYPWKKPVIGLLLILCLMFPSLMIPSLSSEYYSRIWTPFIVAVTIFWIFEIVSVAKLSTFFYSPKIIVVLSLIIPVTGFIATENVRSEYEKGINEIISRNSAYIRGLDDLVKNQPSKSYVIITSDLTAYSPWYRQSGSWLTKRYGTKEWKIFAPTGSALLSVKNDFHYSLPGAVISIHSISELPKQITDPRLYFKPDGRVSNETQ